MSRRGLEDKSFACGMTCNTLLENLSSSHTAEGAAFGHALILLHYLMAQPLQRQC